MNQCEHTIERFQTRYGLELSAVEYVGLCAAIKRRESFIVHQISENETVHLVAYRDELVPVIFDALTQQISTAIHPKSLHWIQQQFLQSMRNQLNSKHQ